MATVHYAFVGRLVVVKVAEETIDNYYEVRAKFKTLRKDARHYYKNLQTAFGTTIVMASFHQNGELWHFAGDPACAEYAYKKYSNARESDFEWQSDHWRAPLPVSEPRGCLFGLFQ